jgi:hypothetical protein
MIFLWDGLERDDKLVLALLAEALDAPDAYASVDDCSATSSAAVIRSSSTP